MKMLFPAIIFSILLLGCTQETPTAKSISDCTADIYDVCIQGLVANGYGNVSLCDKVGSGFKNACYYYAARNSQDNGICQKIVFVEDGINSSYNWKTVCEVVAKNDIDGCSKINSKILDFDFWGDHYQAECAEDLAVLNDKVAICDDLGEYDRTDCYSFYAYYRNKPDVCNKLPNKGEVVSNPQSTCYFEYNNLKAANWPKWIENIESNKRPA
ncbi:MAG: hypothetical protein NT157_01655 [Candidatus Micrarchaeota archaeon]|nr:hypothetical protein [Candidatus Micrarchaeota archaeon]